MEESDLKTSFEESVNYVQSSDNDYKPSKDFKLKMYALYKQATEGDVNIKKPGMLDVVGRAKYNAWKALEGMTNQEAMQTYIDEVQSVRKTQGI